MSEAILRTLALGEKCKWFKHGGGREWCYSAYSGKKTRKVLNSIRQPQRHRMFLPNEVV